MKVAVVLIVKDEAADILAWIGWYVRLGADTLIIYDDGSTDGTRDLIIDAMHCHDIRLFDVVQTAEEYQKRQIKCYINAVASFRAEFEWIGFFDADEFLALTSGETLKDLLQRIDSSGGSALAVHWCNYATSGKILKPMGFTFANFTHHSAAGFRINSHIKSFIKPSLWTGNWYNVHYFEMLSGDYLYADGQPVRWSGTPGISEGEAVWPGAKVMHYQTRSMEHFIERLKKRPDLPGDPNIWYHADWRHEEDLAPRTAVAEISRFVRLIINRTVARSIESCVSKATVSSPKDFGKETGLSQASQIELFLISTHFDTFLRLDKVSGLVLGDGLSPTDPDLLIGLRFKLAPQHLFLLPPDTPNLVEIQGDPRLVNIRSFECLIHGDNGDVALKLPSTRKYLTVEPPDLGGLASATRSNAQGWECFTLVNLQGYAIRTPYLRNIVRMLDGLASSTDPVAYLAETYKDEPALVRQTLPIWFTTSSPSLRREVLAHLSGAAQYIL